MKFAFDLSRGQQFIAGLFGEGLEIFDRSGVRGHDSHNFAGCHGIQKLFRPQDRQRAIEPPNIEFVVKLSDGNGLLGDGPVYLNWIW